MTYATTEELQVADDLGYTYDCNVQRGHRFQLGDRHIWACRADRST